MSASGFAAQQVAENLLRGKAVFGEAEADNIFTDFEAVWRFDLPDVVQHPFPFRQVRSDPDRAKINELVPVDLCNAFQN